MKRVPQNVRLGKLICFYDDNGISIDGHVEGWFTDDTLNVSKLTGGMSSQMLTAMILMQLKLQSKPLKKYPTNLQ